MKTEEIKRKRKGEGSLFKSGGYWYFTYGYTVDGQQRKKKRCIGSVEKFKTEDAAWNEARRVRNQFVTAVATGNVMSSSVENVTCDELLIQYVKHLKLRNKPSAYVIEKCVEASVKPFFGVKKVVKLKDKDFETYREQRISEDGVSDATVDHDLTYLKAALNLEHKKKPHTRVPVVPTIPKSGVDNVRQGFLDLDGYDKVLDKLPVSLKCLFVVGYHIGNRKGTLLNLKWSQIDFEEGLIRFIRKENGKPVPVFAPIYGDMHDWLRHQKAFRDRKYPNCEFVFFWYPIDCDIVPKLKGGRGGRRNEPGTPIKDFRFSWKEAVKEAKHSELLFHDLRRSAVRNMVEKMGWSEKKAMMISGHKTDAMLRRYDIIPTEDIKESGRQADGWWKEQRQKRKRKLKIIRKGKVA